MIYSQLELRDEFPCKFQEVHMHLLFINKSIRAISVAYILLFLSVGFSLASNSPPVIQPISNQVGCKPTDVIIEVEDSENDIISLSVVSSDTNVIPLNNLFISGAGANWTLIISPAQIGNSTITVFADDNNGNVVSTSFNFQSYPVFTLPENVTILPGTFSLPITLNNPLNEDLYGIEFTIDYDPLVLNATDFQLSETKLIHNYLMEYNTGITGQIIVCIASNNAIYTGTGQIGQFVFETISAEHTSLAFSNARVNEWIGLTKEAHVLISSEDQPPVVNSPISDIDVNEDADDMIIDLAPVFTDADNDDLAIIKTLHSNTNPALVTAILSDNSLTLSFHANQNGSAIITIQANSNGVNITDAFEVTVAAVDDAPFVNLEIDNITVEENADDTIISLTHVFIDIDNDLIVHSVESNTNESLVKTTIVDQSLILNYQPGKSGEAIITIRGMAHMLFDETSFIVTVLSVDSPPEVINPILDVTVNEGADNTIIPLTSVFSDPDNDDLSIEKSIITNTHPSVVIATIENNRLILSYPENMNGSSSIIIQGMSNAKRVTDTFDILVLPVDTAPQVKNPINDMTVDEDSQVKMIPLADVFTDIDNDDTQIQFNFNNSNETLLTVTIEQKVLNLSFLPNQYGTANISIQATSHGLTAVDIFTVQVISVNDLPEIFNLVDLNTYESIPVTQTMIANDIESQSLTMTYTISDPQLLPYDNISFVGGNDIDTNQVVIERETPIEIHMTPASGRSGNVTITLNISDGTGNVTQSFDLTVNKYHITATIRGNGQIIPSGIVEVNTNTPSITFQIQPEQDSMIDYLIVDSQSISARPTYTFRNVSDNHTITAVFREPIVYTISTYSDIGGNIYPDGIVQVKEDNSQKFAITSMKGFDIDYLKVDGNYVVATTEYTFQNVKKSHDLEVFFKPVPAPEAAFEESVNSGTYPLVVSFTDKSTHLITTRTWDFGDGSRNSLTHPQHTYFEPGIYTVTLNVKGPGGEDTKIKKNLIEVYDIQVDYTASPATGAYPLTVTFAADMPTTVTHVVWSFGDGEISNQLAPTHLYKESGEYTTQLTAYAGGTAVTIVKSGHIKVKGRNISGRITAADTGAGLAGYQVEIIQRQLNHRVGETYTDENGYYSFVCEPSSLNCLTVLNEIPAATDLIVAVWPPDMSNDYYMQYYHGQSKPSKATLVSTIDSDKTNIDLALEKTSALAITGKISDNGIALDNTKVSAYSEKLAFGLNTLTDENGKYTLNGLKSADDYRVYLWDDQQNSEMYYAIPSNAIPGEAIPTYSVYSWDAATPVDPTSGQLDHIDIVLDHAINKRGMIQGQLRIDSQEMAKNIWVYAFSDELNIGNGAFTDENGYYTITALSEVSESDPLTMGYIVAVHSIQHNNQDENPSNLWYTYQAYPGVSDKSNAQPVRTGVTGIDFMLITQCQLTGTVMDIYDTLIPDAVVTVHSEKAGKDFQSALTDINGNYAFTGLPPVNDYVVVVTAPNYPITYYKNYSESKHADPINLSYGNVGNIDFKLDTGMVIRGYVYMDTINTPAPEGLWVNIWSKSTQTGGDVRTDINGQYQKVGLNPNASDYIISIRIEDYMPAFYRDNKDSDLMNDTVYLSIDAEGIAPSSLQWAFNRNLILRTGLSISGKVLHNGLLASGVEVEAFSGDGWDNDISKGYLTDGHNYKLSGLTPGEYIVKIKPLNFQDDTYRVDLINEDVNNILFPLKELTSRICGTVYGLELNQHAQIVAWAEEKGYNHTYNIVGTGETTAYTISVKPSADYHVKFTAGNGYPDQWYNAQTSEDAANIISVADGVVSGIDFHVSSGSQRISGTVHFPMSAQIGDIVWIDAHSPLTGSNGSTEIMLENGHTATYVISGLKKAADFIVVAWGKNYQEQYYRNQTTESSATPVDTGDAIPDHEIDFDMNPGASISGNVYQDGNPATDLFVEAFSESTSSFGGHSNISNGSFLIEGLDQANDYILKVYKTGMAPFYYHTSGNTREEKLATKVSTLENKHVTGINIHTFQLESISGTVRDEEGKALSDIWVNVSSFLKKSGEGIYTAKDGTYLIGGLSKSDDYIVSIDEHANLSYVPEEKTNVKSGSSGVNFILRKAFHLKGMVVNTSNEPIVKAQVELYSDEVDFDVWTRTDASGTFNIKCVPSANDYVLSVMPYEDFNIINSVSYVKFNEAGLTIDANHTIDRLMEKEIILKHGGYIIGHIFKTDGITPVKDAEITVYSHSIGKESSGNAISNSEGYYQINNIPIGSDYIITVKTKNYAQATKIDQSTGTTVDFVLEIGGSINGRVIEEEGAPLAEIQVGIESDTASFSNSILTDINGNFIFSGLPRYLDSGQSITDYLVKIFPGNYPTQSQGQKQIGEYVTFVCKKGGEITGTITDSQGNSIPENIVLSIKAYHVQNEGGYETKTGANQDGSFVINSLLFNTNYQVKVIVIENEVEKSEQWIDSDGLGMTQRNDAGVFMAGSHVSIRLSGTWNGLIQN